MTTPSSRPRSATRRARSSAVSAPRGPRPARVRFTATLAAGLIALPRGASAKLPSRGLVSVTGTLNGAAFRTTLEPDGQGGHTLKVDARLRRSARVAVGDEVTLDLAPVTPDQEPEPRVPADLKRALALAGPGVAHAWKDITTIARRDWIHWVTSGKLAQTRAVRIAKACDMLAKGKRRPCCFDRSGMYSSRKRPA